MSKHKKRRNMSEISVDPEQRIRKFEVADPKRAGMRVVDNCAEEHQQ